MPKRLKCETCDKARCTNHLFQLKPLEKGLYFGKVQKAKLCPKLNKKTNNFQKSMPQVNKDNKFYTPSFILEEEVSFYSDNDQRMKKNHQQKINDMMSGITGSMLVPKHGRKTMYCTVCQAKYDDYLQHIKDPLHKDKLSKSRMNKPIKQMAQHYEKRRNIQSMPISNQETSDVIKISTKEKQNEKIYQQNNEFLDVVPIDAFQEIEDVEF